MKFPRIKILAVIWSSAIAVGTLARTSKLGEHLHTDGLPHVCAHVAVFAVLGWLLVQSTVNLRVKARAISLLLCIAAGAGTEIYEHLAFGKWMEYGDVVANILGILVGYVIGARLLLRPHSTLENS